MRAHARPVPLMLISFVVGVLFAIGLGLSGMTSPDRVVGFLDFAGEWDPALMFVMGGAIPVYALAFRLSGHRRGPLLGGKFRLPTRRSIDGRLLAGAALFGLGWGLAGYCPGPAVASLPVFNSQVLVFVAAMAAGLQLGNLLEAARARAERAAANQASSETASPDPARA